MKRMKGITIALIILSIVSLTVSAFSIDEMLAGLFGQNENGHLENISIKNDQNITNQIEVENKSNENKIPDTINKIKKNEDELIKRDNNYEYLKEIIENTNLMKLMKYKIRTYIDYGCSSPTPRLYKDGPKTKIILMYNVNAEPCERHRLVYENWVEWPDQSEKGNAIAHRMSTLVLSFDNVADAYTIYKMINDAVETSTNETTYMEFATDDCKYDERYDEIKYSEPSGVMICDVDMDSASSGFLYYKEKDYSNMQ